MSIKKRLLFSYMEHVVFMADFLMPCLNGLLYSKFGVRMRTLVIRWQPVYFNRVPVRTL